LEETIRNAKCLYDQQKGRSTFQKAWEDKMKSKVEQGKNGTKPPFFINTVQGQPNSKEPRMTETVGKNPWKQSIQCWSCAGDHMHRDFPQRGDKASIVHNVQEVAKV
jgi:hypothetical protein